MRSGHALPAAARPPVLMRRPRPAHLPLAPAQERMWHAARAGRSADWNVARAVRIRGASIDVDALVVALTDVVARHEPLRTRYPATEHGPEQVVVPIAEADLDIRVCPVSEADLPTRLAEFAGREFDLAAQLPLRARVYVLSEDDVVLLLVAHHISIDGRSVAPLIATWAPPIPPARAAGRRFCRRFRSSTPITRCGSTPSSVSTPTSGAAPPSSCATGPTPSPDGPRCCGSPTIGPVPRCRPPTARPSRWLSRHRCTPPCSHAPSGGGPACSWSCRRCSRCVSAGSAAATTSPWRPR
ncbi:hypothetical protein IU435_01115 [Nocardia cyriacigeorgica]|nr:hypothetical protein [Nocardia cyriacigeorgica]